MKKDQSCNHADIQIGFAPEAYEDTNVRRIILQASCKHCGERQRFIGIDEGSSLNRPCASPDGFTVFLPVVMGFDDAEHVQRLNA